MIKLKSRTLMLIIGVGIVGVLFYPTLYTRTESATLEMGGGEVLATEQFVIQDGMVCFPIPTAQVIYQVVTATPESTPRTPTPTLTPSPTRTPTPALILPSNTPRPNTPTPATPAVDRTITPVSNAPKCTLPGTEHALDVSGTYEVTGLWQYIRTIPTTANNAPVSSAQNGAIFEVYWTAVDSRGVLWAGIARTCDRWLSTTLGILNLD